MRLASSILLLAACGAGGPEALMRAPELRATPWPSDALFGSDGKLRVATPFSFDAGNEDNLLQLARTLSEDDGFGTLTSVFFPVSGEVRVAPGATASVLDLDGDDPPRAFPLLYRAETRTLVAISPTGTVLREHHRYACVVERGVNLHPSAAMEEALASSPLPAYAALRKRHVHALAATAFTTHTLTAWVPKVLADLAAMAPRAHPTRVFHAGAELDALFGGPVTTTRPGMPPSGGVRHPSVALVVEGSYASPHYLAETPGVLGLFDAGPTVRATDSIPFLLVLPKRASLQRVPVVIFQHGIGGDRSSVLTVADDYAARGYATLGIDELWHGSRQPGAVDEVNNLSGAREPDGIGDAVGLAVPYFFDFNGDSSRGVPALDPRYMRDNLRQATVDLMQEVRLAGGDWSEVAGFDAALAGLSLDASALVYTGESFGALLGGQAFAVDPLLRAAVLDVGGGGWFLDLIGNSATFAQTLQPFVAGGYDESVDVNHPVELPVRAQQSLNLMQTILEPGDGLALSGAADAQKSVLFLEAFNDEVVSNHATEALARAWGATEIMLAEGSAPTRVVMLPQLAAPQSGAPLRALVQLAPATHNMFTGQQGERKFEDGFPPFVKRAAPITIDNPIERAHALALGFIDGFRAGAAAVVQP